NRSSRHIVHTCGRQKTRHENYALFMTKKQKPPVNNQPGSKGSEKWLSTTMPVFWQACITSFGSIGIRLWISTADGKSIVALCIRFSRSYAKCTANRPSLV